MAEKLLFLLSTTELCYVCFWSVFTVLKKIIFCELTTIFYLCNFTFAIYKNWDTVEIAFFF